MTAARNEKAALSHVKLAIICFDELEHLAELPQMPLPHPDSPLAPGGKPDPTATGGAVPLLAAAYAPHHHKGPLMRHDGNGFVSAPSLRVFEQSLAYELTPACEYTAGERKPLYGAVHELADAVPVLGRVREEGAAARTFETAKECRGACSNPRVQEAMLAYYTALCKARWRRERRASPNH